MLTMESSFRIQLRELQTVFIHVHVPDALRHRIIDPSSNVWFVILNDGKTDSTETPAERACNLLQRINNKFNNDMKYGMDWPLFRRVCSSAEYRMQGISVAVETVMHGNHGVVNLTVKEW